MKQKLTDEEIDRIEEEEKQEHIRKGERYDPIMGMWYRLDEVDRPSWDKRNTRYVWEDD